MNKKDSRVRRVRGVRMKIRKNSDRPILIVYRSNKHTYGQVIDQATGKVLAQASTLDASLKNGMTGNAEAAKRVGGLIAQRAKANGISKIAFDRSGYRYHGRIKALADGVREAGIQF